MANTRIFALLSFFSYILFAVAATSASLPTCSGVPSSNKTVPFTIDLTWGDFNPNGGVTRKAILTNGTIPGPALKVEVGSLVHFKVINNLPFATTVHFHGIQQSGTPYSDGVPGLSQEPIPAGATFLYTWIADEVGTYFYHAHNKGQMMDGLYGAILVTTKDSSVKPFSLISNDTAEVEKMLAAEAKNEPVFISDWSQYTFQEFYDIQQAANIDNACTDSIIINGKGSVYCLSRDEITAYTSPLLGPLLASNNPSQLTNKGCLPANLIPTQGPYQFNLTNLPPNAYDSCTPSTGATANISVDQTNGYAALTFVNSGGFSALKFTIDNHKFWVYAASGSYVIPQYVDQVQVDGGERYSILVKLDQPVGQYAIRVANAGLNQIISGTAMLSYAGATGPAVGAFAAMNYAGINTTTVTSFVDVIGAPFPASVPAANADVTHFFNITKLDHPYVWTMTGKSSYNMSNDDGVPLLFQSPDSVPLSDLIIKTTNGQWVDLVIQVAGPLAQPHPIHKHSNKMYFLGAGTGPFAYDSVAAAAAAMPAGTFNFANPPYRDGFTTIPAQGNSSWMAVRYYSDNPGAWALHCHMQTHFSGGMAAVLLDGVDKFPTVPQAYSNGTGLCGSSSTTSGKGNATTTATPSATSSGITKYTNPSSSSASFSSPSALLGLATTALIAALFSL